MYILVMIEHYRFLVTALCRGHMLFDWHNCICYLVYEALPIGASSGDAGHHQALDCALNNDFKTGIRQLYSTLRVMLNGVIKCNKLFFVNL